MTKLEEVARAIGDSISGGPSDDLLNPHALILAARAAIEAMREPTNGMLAALPCAEGRVYGINPTGEEGAEMWRAMIDAALEEK